MPIDPNRFIPLSGNQGALPASTGVDFGTGLDRLMEQSPNAAPGTQGGGVTGSLAGTGGDTALSVISALTGLATPGIIGLPGLGLAGKGAEYAGVPGARGLGALFAGLAGANPAGAMKGIASLADATVNTPGVGAVNQTAAFGNSLSDLGFPSSSVALSNPVAGTFNTFSGPRAGEVAQHGELQADSQFANMPSMIGSNETLSSTPPGLAGINAAAGEMNMTGPASLGIGAGSIGLAGMSLSGLNGLAASLGIAPTAQNLSDLSQVQTPQALQDISQRGRGLIDTPDVTASPVGPVGLTGPTNAALGDLADPSGGGGTGPSGSGNDGGVGAGGVGGVGAGGPGSGTGSPGEGGVAGWKHGGRIPDLSKLPGGAEPIVAHEGEFVVNAPAAKRHMPWLNKINKGGLARLMGD